MAGTRKTTEVKALTTQVTYAFCETITATGATPWHIRKLSDKGIKIGGGADTPALCGRVVSWDIGVKMTPGQIQNTCHKCVAIWDRENGNERAD
jgi:hypothetical protein